MTGHQILLNISGACVYASCSCGDLKAIVRKGANRVSHAKTDGFVHLASEDRLEELVLAGFDPDRDIKMVLVQGVQP